MTSISETEFQQLYQKGKLAFEKGHYRLSVENLEKACQWVSLHSKKGAEVRIWLVNAYQAMGDTEKAMTLCAEVVANSYGETKVQASRLLYILKAPQLQRPKEWMTEIPDLTKTSQNISNYVPVSKPRKIKPKPQILLEDLNNINTKENTFIWLTMIVTGVTVLGLFIIP